MDLKIILLHLIRMCKIGIKSYENVTMNAQEGKYLYVVGKCNLAEITKYISKNFTGEH